MYKDLRTFLSLRGHKVAVAIFREIASLLLARTN